MDDDPPLAGPSRPSPLPLSNLLLQLGSASPSSRGIEIEKRPTHPVLTDTNPSPLSGSQDLLSLFHLTPLYDTYVRPYLPTQAGEGAESPRVEGKGKEKAFTSLGFTMGGVRIEGEKVKKAKMERSYAGLILDIPGALRGSPG